MKHKLLILVLTLALTAAVMLPQLLLGNIGSDPQIPRLYLEGDISGMTVKEDLRTVAVRYENGGDSFKGYATVKIQGSSSLYYHKKNYNIKFFTDETCTRKLSVDLGWGTQAKYCLKANWTDKTHGRNLVTAGLAAEAQKKYGILNSAPANGLVEGFPVEVYTDGDFLGLYTLNIPKDEWLLALNKDDPRHIAVYGESWNPSTLFHAMPDFEAWTVEAGEENDETLDRLNRLFSFVMNSSDAEFRSDFEEYMNLDAALNYHVLMHTAFLADNVGKNMLLVTYDGEVWYPCLYDLDTSWGVTWDGRTLHDCESGLMDTSNSLLWARMEQLFGPELSRRYFELREDILSREHILAQFEAWQASIPESSFQKEIRRWGSDIPGHGISQIEAYLDTVTPMLDEKYTALGEK